MPLTDWEAVRETLRAAFPDIEWTEDGFGRLKVGGRSVEFMLPEGDRTLSLRTSFLADYTDFVQSLCDRFGWLAFDEEPQCYQPHQPPMPA